MSIEGTERIGDVLDGRYELRDVMARGAQGLLYRARDLKDGDDVAIKMLRDALSDPDVLERREARAMTQLRHTSAVRVLDHVHATDGSMGLVMELLHGHELAELEAAGERMPPDRIIGLLEPIVTT